MDVFETSGEYFDGETAASAQVPVLISPNGVKFQLGGDWIDWPMTDLRCLQDQARDAGMILDLEDNSEARLIVKDRAATQYLWSLPNALTKRKTSSKMKRRVLFWGAGAITSVCLIMFVIVPALSDTLARYIPIEREVALGKYSLKQIEWLVSSDETDLVCQGEAGQAALAKMATRLKDNFETDYPLEVRVFRHEMVNAFAVPGGQIVLFEGLIAAAETPEEVAGVLGHEFGHVVNRDPTRLSLRSAGSAGLLGLVFGDFAGGFAALALAEALVSANYSQDAETQADIFSHQLFARAKLPSKDFARFFKQLREDSGGDEGLMSHISSHPDLSAREQAAIDADVIADGDFTPVLTNTEWLALKQICTEKS
jgi:Zn-dependent protease with chaperone function